MEQFKEYQMVKVENTDQFIINGKEYNVVNQELKTNLIVYSKADTLGSKLQWTKAYAIYNIVSNELIEKDNDFKTIDSLATLIGLDKKTLQKYCRAVPGRENLKELEGVESLSINSVDMLTALSNNDMLKGFISWLKRKKIISFAGMSENKLNELIKTYKDKVKENEETEENEEKENVKEDKEEMVLVEYKDKKYNIPLSVLEDYEVVEG